MFPGPNIARKGPSYADADRMLKELANIRFNAKEHTQKIEDTLSKMADWTPEMQNGGERLAKLWADRIYKELETLPVEDPYLNIHRKGIRRLHMMCGRVECLPRDCEVIGIVPPIGADPDYTTAMSDVYKTVDGSRIVALKRIRAASRPENEKVRKSFNREALIWKLVRHERIVPFLGILRAADPRDAVYLVSQWMEFDKLPTYLRKQPSQDPLKYICQVVEGLSYIHMLDMVHGDLKGGNVLVDSAFNARIADFGHTVSLTSTGMNSTTSQSGTAAYMAPELLDCSESATEESQRPSTHSDVYALGILIWELFADVNPFNGIPELKIPQKSLAGQRPLRQDAPRLCVAPGIGRDGARKNRFWEVIEGCWKQNPQQRLRLEEVKAKLDHM